MRTLRTVCVADVETSVDWYRALGLEATPVGSGATTWSVANPSGTSNYFHLIQALMGQRTAPEVLVVDLDSSTVERLAASHEVALRATAYGLGFALRDPDGHQVFVVTRGAAGA